MNFLKIFLGFVAGMVISLVIALAYFGAFSQVQIERGSKGPYEFVYATHKGPYKNLSQSWEKFAQKWKDVGLKKCLGMAVYLDPPSAAQSTLRSIIGCQINGLPADMVGQAREKLPLFTIPEVKALTSSFPFINEFSYFLGPMKVYPKMQKIIEDEKIIPAAAIEFYGENGVKTQVEFIMPTDLDPKSLDPLKEAFN